MFSTLKNLKEKYQNSSSWTELFVSFFPALDDIYKRLGEAKNDKERVKILTEGLELSQQEIKRLMEENIRLQNSILEKDLEIKKLRGERSNGVFFDNLKSEVNGLTNDVLEVKTLIEIYKK